MKTFHCLSESGFGKAKDGKGGAKKNTDSLAGQSGDVVWQYF